MPELVVRDGALGGEGLVAAQQEVRASPYVFGERGAAGLTATFNISGLPELRERFGFLARLYDVVMPPRSYGRIFGWRERLTELLATNRPNAFHLRIFALHEGEQIAPRVATTLQRRVNAPYPHPRVMSCLFLDPGNVGAGSGLRLVREGRVVAEVSAVAGRLVQFRGDLEYGVTPVRGADGPSSVIVLCEQYSFAGPVAERLPPLAVSSAPRFEAALAEAKVKGPPDFLVDGVDGEAHTARELLEGE